MRTRMRSRLRKILVVGFIAGIAVSSRADFMPGFLGNTRTLGEALPGFDGSVSFAVLDKTGLTKEFLDSCIPIVISP